jgi:hypothetical protein
MKIPATLDICGVGYKIVWKPDTAMHNSIGETRYNECEIWLNEKYKEHKDRMAQVFLHEIIHATAEELNIGISEDQVNNLAVGLNPIIHRII